MALPRVITNELLHCGHMHSEPTREVLGTDTTGPRLRELVLFFFFHTHSLSSFWTSCGHRCRSFFPWFSPSVFITHRVQQSDCSPIFHRVLLTQALVVPASQFVHKKTSPRIYTRMHSGGFELTKLTYYSIPGSRAT